MKKLVINCSPDWEVEIIKEVIKVFSAHFPIGGGLTLVNSGPNVIQGSTKKKKFLGAFAPQYKGTFTIRENPSDGKDLEIDYEEGSIFKNGKSGMWKIKNFWVHFHKGLNEILEKPYSYYEDGNFLKNSYD